jgi:hypothetical protein
MKSEMCCETHLLYAVMNFMEFPQPWNAMEQSMNIPLHEICNEEHQSKLNQDWPARNFDCDQVCYAYNAQQVSKSLNGHIGYRVVANKRKKKEVEKHVKPVKPKVSSDGFLLYSPWQC